MQIISWQFAVFVIVTLVVYYLLPRKSQNIWLLAASLGFLLTWNVFSVVVLLVSIAINYFAGNRIWRNGVKKKGWLWIGIVVNVAVLIFFRFETSGYLEKAIRAFLNLAIPPVHLSCESCSRLDSPITACKPSATWWMYPRSSVNLPVTWWILHFTWHISRGCSPVRSNARAPSFLRLAAPRVVDNDRIARGFTRIVIGLLRKVVIAGILSSYIPEDMFSAPANYSTLGLIFQMLLYAFWVYNDFAGYTSIVRGISDFLGLDLSPNFDTPYFAHSFTDFWNRWHISLSHWLRDYIFFPFSRYLLRRKINPRSIIYLAVPPLLTMLVSGLWHNFGAYMIFWGLLHGLLQSFEKLASRGKPVAKWEDKPVLRKAGSILLVFIGVILTWIPFASGSLYRVWDYIKAVFTSTVEPEITTLWLIPLFAIIINFGLDLMHYRQNDELAVRRLPVFAQSALLAAALLAILISFLGSESVLTSFVYQGF